MPRRLRANRRRSYVGETTDAALIERFSTRGWPPRLLTDPERLFPPRTWVLPSGELAASAWERLRLPSWNAWLERMRGECAFWLPGGASFDGLFYRESTAPEAWARFRAAHREEAAAVDEIVAAAAKVIPLREATTK